MASFHRGQILGLEKAEALLAKWGQGAAAVARGRVVVGTSVVYAWGQHFGRYRNGRLARRAGGAFFLLTPFRQFSKGFAKDVLRAVPKGDDAVFAVERQYGLAVEGQAKVLAPVGQSRKGHVGGNLRGSIHTVITSR